MNYGAVSFNPMKIIVFISSFWGLLNISCQKAFHPEEAKVIMIFGQSNATSNDINLSLSFNGSPANVWAYDSNTAGFTKYDSSKLINNGLGTQAGINLVNTKKLNKIFTLRVAKGALAISNWDYPNGMMWIKTSNDINNAFKWLSAQGYPVVTLSAIWMQGENDIAVNTSQVVYQEKLNSFITKLRELKAGLANTQFVMMKISSKQAFSRNSIAIVNTSMDNIAASKSNCISVNPDVIGATLSSDGVHYSNSGFITIANYWSRLIP